ncbi:MAG: FKBP-type peptidyl-prolyl cis-trans isomerase [Gammaproteobacteria bacterium]
MQIANNTVVSIHYTLTNDQGEVLDTSRGHEALSYLHGAGNIIKGLEKALSGKAAGDTLTVTIEPEDAYGEYTEEYVQVLPRAAFQNMEDVEAGMQFHADIGFGPQIITILQIDAEGVVVDGNHQLAGEALTFDVEITGVRPASAEELSHGHVHGPGCHHH